jgi:hypothetical protein
MNAVTQTTPPPPPVLKESYEIVDRQAPFEDGFNWKTIAAALFVCLFMMPSSILISWSTGTGLGAASWVTVILFVEISKRALVKLKTQEVLLIYWISSGLVGAGPFGSWIWNQFLIQSPQAASIREWLPAWLAPSPDVFPEVYSGRTFFHAAWLLPLGIMLVTSILGMIHNLSSGYILYRLVNDIEKLPFPMAKVHALGATALAESSQGKETWRWRMFSAGAMAGMLWGAIYIGIPVVGGLFWDPPPMLIQIPFWDFTSTLTELGLCAVPLALSVDFFAFMAGWIIPWENVLGVFIGTLITFIAFPIMYSYGLLPHWENGFGALATGMTNGIDFGISFGIGIALLVAVAGIASTIRHVRRSLREAANSGGTGDSQPAKLPPGRGDISLWLAVAIWVASTLAMMGASWLMLNYSLRPGEVGISMVILFLMGFVYSPLVQYVNARMTGMMGGGSVGLPYLKEATVYLSGARGARVWFAPLMVDSGDAGVETFKQLELTRTKFGSYIKMACCSIVILFIFSFIYCSILWNMGPIPSSAFPYIQRFWPYQAIGQVMWVKTTLPAEPGVESIFSAFLHPQLIVAGVGVGALAMLLLRLLRAPAMLFYGLVFALGSQSFVTAIPMFLGAVLGRYVIRRRVGEEKWSAYAPLIMAGFGAGMGLAGLFAVGFALMWKAASG